MAVELTATDYSGIGTGALANYATGIYANGSDQIKVYVAGELKTLGDDYSLSGVGSEAGVDVVANFPSGAAVYIERATPITQNVDTQNNETILEDVLDASLDKLTLIAQELGGKTDLSLLFPKGERGYQLPAAASRANRTLSFDALGAPFMSSGTGVDAALRTDLASAVGTALLAFNRQTVGAVTTTLQAELMALPARPEQYGAVGYSAFEDWASLTTAQKNLRLAVAAGNDISFQRLRDNHAVAELGPYRYYVTQLVKWNLSDRTLRGAGSGYGGNRASIICLIGPNAATSTVFQFGGDNAGSPVRGSTIHQIGFSREGVTPAASTTGHAEDCVKAVVCQYVTNSEISRTRAYKSPVGYHMINTGNLRVLENNHETSGSESVTKDIMVSFLMGGYATYGTYVGANGSLRMEGNDAFNHPLTTKYSAGFLLYGYIADTWLERCEAAGGKFGLDVTQLVKADAITYFGNGDGTGGSVYVSTPNSGNDITIANCRMDGSALVGFYYHHLSNSTSINFLNKYAAGSAQQIALNQIDGRVSIIGGELIPNAAGQRGIDANNVAVLGVRGTFIRDMAAPVTIANCGGVFLDVEIYNPNYTAADAVLLNTVSRSRIAATIRGAAARFTRGITCVGTTCGFNSVDGTCIDYGAFVSANAAQKVQYNGADARGGFGTNVLVGVTE